MYGIIEWTKDNSYVAPIINKDGSIRIFESLEEADIYADKLGNSDDLRVISLEGVRN